VRIKVDTSWLVTRFGWGALLGAAIGGPDVDVPAYAAPARVSDASGLPPPTSRSGKLSAVSMYA